MLTATPSESLSVAPLTRATLVQVAPHDPRAMLSADGSLFDMRALASISVGAGAALEFVAAPASAPARPPFPVSDDPRAVLVLQLDDGASVAGLPALRRRLHIDFSGHCAVAGRAALAASELVPAFQAVTQSPATPVATLDVSGLRLLRPLPEAPAPAASSSSSAPAPAPGLLLPPEPLALFSRADSTPVLRARRAGSGSSSSSDPELGATPEDPVGVLNERVGRRAAALIRLADVKGFLRPAQASGALAAYAAADELCVEAAERLADGARYGDQIAARIVEQGAAAVRALPTADPPPAAWPDAEARCVVCATAPPAFRICARCVATAVCEECLDRMVVEYGNEACPTCRAPMCSRRC